MIIHCIINRYYLAAYMYRRTQNQNESLSGIIWKRVPKQRFIKLKIFKIGVYDSVAHFIVGNMVTLLIYGAVGIDKC